MEETSTVVAYKSDHKRIYDIKYENKLTNQQEVIKFLLDFHERNK